MSLDVIKEYVSMLIAEADERSPADLGSYNRLRALGMRLTSTQRQLRNKTFVWDDDEAGAQFFIYNMKNGVVRLTMISQTELHYQQRELARGDLTTDDIVDIIESRRERFIARNTSRLFVVGSTWALRRGVDPVVIHDADGKAYQLSERACVTILDVPKKLNDVLYVRVDVDGREFFIDEEFLRIDVFQLRKNTDGPSGFVEGTTWTLKQNVTHLVAYEMPELGAPIAINPGSTIVMTSERVFHAGVNWRSIELDGIPMWIKEASLRPTLWSRWTKRGKPQEHWDLYVFVRIWPPERAQQAADVISNFIVKTLSELIPETIVKVSTLSANRSNSQAKFRFRVSGKIPPRAVLEDVKTRLGDAIDKFARVENIAGAVRFNESGEENDWPKGSYYQF